MATIALIRPGSTDYDSERRIQGTLDVPLNPHGWEEVRGMIEALRPLDLDVIYAPRSQPARETAATIAKALEIRTKRLDGMQNLDYGLWQGMLVDEVRRKQPKVFRQWQERPETVCPPSGEMIEEADERIRAVLSRIVRRHKGDVLGLVVPEPLASLVRRQLMQGELGDLWEATAEHGRFEVLEVEPAALVAS